jgi:site-specific recombinase XerD
MALEKWIRASGKKRTDYLFPGNRRSHGPMTIRSLSRLLKDWVTEAGLDPADYSIGSLRRTKALHISKAPEICRRYLGLKTKADPIEVSRAFDI